MDWNRTKTILILTFLVFNIFLLSDLISKRTDISGLEQLQQVTLEEKLDSFNVTYKKKPTVQTENMPYISGKVHEFNEKEEKTLEEGTSQEIELDGNKLISTLEKPYPINDPTRASAFSIFLETYVYEGSKYEYSHSADDKNIIYFVETYKDDRPIYNQNSGMLIVSMEDNKVTSYTQTYLDLSSITEERKIDPASDAIEVLLNQQYIELNDVVEDVSLGYYTVTNEDEREKIVFVPTWRVVLTNSKNEEQEPEVYYVDAIEKNVFSATEDDEEIEESEEEGNGDNQGKDLDPSTPQPSSGEK
ncbi:two-component system regulatory protein YycI [Alkalihalobacillus sp. CinArs1]|uniref:two-component system regulatory protein YycI n=1 Tax=Alkalihalobacillus sp. CinArs1 TaxID=2995314 RepID=UPI0022DD9C85|nr:two-component system regulatory protein YycI [Alkalihalobacillus sp. CinArs1]